MQLKSHYIEVAQNYIWDYRILLTADLSKQRTISQQKLPIVSEIPTMNTNEILSLVLFPTVCSSNLFISALISFNSFHLIISSFFHLTGYPKKCATFFTFRTSHKKKQMLWLRARTQLTHVKTNTRSETRFTRSNDDFSTTTLRKRNLFVNWY